VRIIKMAEVTGLAHVGIFVDDVERSKKFYNEILGLETVWQCTFDADGNTFTCAFVRKGALTLELVQRKIGENPGDGVTDHVAMLVDDIDGFRKILEAKGIEFETEEQMYCSDMFPNGTKWVFFRGPDNEHIEISQLL
jgi:lactoylglutathione lyase